LQNRPVHIPFGEWHEKYGTLGEKITIAANETKHVLRVQAASRRALNLEGRDPKTFWTIFISRTISAALLINGATWISAHDLKLL
jgi:hypothetical protein